MRESGLRVSSICRGGMFTHADPTEVGALRDDNRRAIDEAHALDADCLVMVCGAPRGGSLERARRQIRDGLAELAPYATAAGVRLAVEPMHPMMIADRSAISSLSEANDLVEELGVDVVGIALDAYHVFWDVTYPAEVARAGARIYSVQVCDWVTPIHGQLSSRGMPGEGVIDLRAFVDHAEAAGYSGLIEVEVLSDLWWARQPEEALQAALDGFGNI